MHQRELAEKNEEEESDSSGEEANKFTLARGEDNPGLGDRNPESGNCNPELGNCHPELGNRNPDSGNSNPGKENDQQGEKPVPMDVNMVFTIPIEFCVPTKDVTELALGAERAVFNKPENSGVHMKPLFLRGQMDGTLIKNMLIDGGASINILSLSLFKKLSHVEGDLKRTNLSFSSFAGDLTEAKGIICKDVVVGRKTIPMAFFMVEMKGCYNVLLGRDCIHANECVPSTLHQCVIQGIGDEVEVVQANEDVCVAMAKSQVDKLGGMMECLSSKDLTEYNYISVGKDGFVPISVKPVIGATRLAHSV
jgi:hypothetical protein